MDSVEPGMAILIFISGFIISCLSGFIGIGGGVILVPVLIFLPPLLGIGTLSMREIAGLTITQSLFACLSGAIRHDKNHFVNRRLVTWMGVTIVFSALAGAVLSRWMANEALKVIFAALALIAAVLMFIPKKDGKVTDSPNGAPFNRALAVIIALVIGLLGGMVGQGGSFILIPLMLYVLRLPTRVVIGSNLAIVFLASLAGFIGKLSTAQIPLFYAALLVVAAFPGAQIGSILSKRTNPAWLRAVLAILVVFAAIGIVVDVLV